MLEKTTPVKQEAVSRADAVDLGVGARLKTVRENAGLSQRELAKKAGVTNATISLVEQEAHAPSLASLHKILSAIPISMADFFALPATQQSILFYDNDDLAVVQSGAVDMRVMGSERRDKKMQMFIEHYLPGAGTGKEPLSHDGETAAFILEGEVEIEISGEARKLAKGGGFHLFTKQPYRLTNTGDTIAIVVCSCTPPMI
jgi:transcriptional regulator with XRE-family HTH domain